MVHRDEVLDAVQDLTLATRRLPTLLEVAKAVGLTKQGVLHHFPTRAALDAAVALRAVARVDSAMSEAAKGGSPVETYLRLSSPSADDQVAVLVLAAALQRVDRSDLPSEVEQSVARWQAMIAEEVGDPVRAEVVRLVGDGLFAEALLSGAAPSPERVDRLVAHLRTDTRERRA